jgi:hypothetical protein
LLKLVFSSRFNLGELILVAEVIIVCLVVDKIKKA